MFCCQADRSAQDFARYIRLVVEFHRSAARWRSLYHAKFSARHRHRQNTASAWGFEKACE